MRIKKMNLRNVCLCLCILYSGHAASECNFVDPNGPWTAWVSIPANLSIPHDSQVGDVIHSDAGWQQLGTTHLRCSQSGMTTTGYDFPIEESSIPGVYKLPNMPELGIRITYDNTINNSEVGNLIFQYPSTIGPHTATGFTPTGNFKVEIILLSSLVNFMPDSYSVAWPEVIGSVRYSDLLVGTVKPLNTAMNITVTNDEYCYITPLDAVNFQNVSLERLRANQLLGSSDMTIHCPYTTTNEPLTRTIRFNGQNNGSEFITSINGVGVSLRNERNEIIPPNSTVTVGLTKVNAEHIGHVQINVYPQIDENIIPTVQELGEWLVDVTLE
jgi:hypothetical protein